MQLAHTLARLSLVATLLLPAALSTAHAKKDVGDKVNITPSIPGGAPLKLAIYNFNPTPMTGYWVTPAGILQSLPGAATIPPTGTKPIIIGSFRYATILLQRQAGGGVWKHLGGNAATPFIIAGTPPAGFKSTLAKGQPDGTGGEVPDDRDGPDVKKKKTVNVTNVTQTTTNVTPPAQAPAAAEPEQAKRKGPRPGKDPLVAEFLRIHNAARKSVGVAPLAWSDDLAQSAQAWADQLARAGRIEHQPNAKYGENLGMGSGNYSPASAANAWLAEKGQYDPDASAPKGRGRKAAKAGHYTQMIWSKSAAVGYGVAKTADGQTVVVAHYNPSGNVIGEKPYTPKP